MMIVRSVLMALGICLALAGSTDGQTFTVSGTVLDESGGVVPGASATLTSASASTGPLVAFTDRDGQYRLEGVPPGTYRLVVSLGGFADGLRDDIVVGGADVVLPLVTLEVADLTEVVVVTASKTPSKLVDAPVTMTVLQGDALTATPAQNFADLLRVVPGVNAIQMSARDVNLTSRRATSTAANSQLTLLDGRSIYLDFFGLVLWDFVPSNTDDIKQIEVVRGPASAVWGANALTGVVNVITKSPREAPGTMIIVNTGLFGRDAGSTAGRGAGSTFGANATTSQAINDRWAYRVSAGFFGSESMPRPAGQIPVIADPRDPSRLVGGAFYPGDGRGPLGITFENPGTRQPKFDVRLDQQLRTARVTYAAGVAGTEGTAHTGIGPFDIQPGSVMAYAKLDYAREAFEFRAFTNIVSAEAPNLLVPDPGTGRPLQLDFDTETYDVEIRHSSLIGTRQVASYGGNIRRNQFAITIAPLGRDRTEVGAYVQDQIFLDRVQLTLGARMDKFGSLPDPVFSPRVSVALKPHVDHSVRFSFNRAFRAPSVVNHGLDIALVAPVDLSGLSPFLPPPLQPAVSQPFPLVVRAVGSELPIGGVLQEPLTEEGLTAYEVNYTGLVREGVTVGASFYVNDIHDSIDFSQLPTNLDPYTTVTPPPGWPLPPALLGVMAQLGIFLPRTGFTYLNLGPVRDKGLELSLDYRVNRTWTTFANYSWQARPTILDDPDPYPTTELALPPTHRFNVGGRYVSASWFGSLSVSYSDRAFWSDVLTSPYHGFTDAYAMVNASVGKPWRQGRIVTVLKSTNLFDQTIQQHVFGDLLKRTVTAEVRFRP